MLKIDKILQYVLIIMFSILLVDCNRFTVSPNRECWIHMQKFSISFADTWKYSELRWASRTLALHTHLFFSWGTCKFFSKNYCNFNELIISVLNELVGNLIYISFVFCVTIQIFVGGIFLIFPNQLCFFFLKLYVFYSYIRTSLYV